MNQTQKGIISLIKSAILQTSQELPDQFDLESAYALVKKHHMSALIFEGALQCGVDPKSEIMMKLFRMSMLSLRTSKMQMGQVEKITQAFDANGIDYLLLKGCRMKSLYPKPELRVMGDADVLIRMEQYDKIMHLLDSLDMVAVKESDYELVWKNDALYLELHKRILPSYHKDLYAETGDGWNLAVRHEGNRYFMTEEIEFVYMLSHFAKHYREGGIGCRHVVDLWVYLRAYPNMDQKIILKELKKMHLLEFYVNIRYLIGVWFDGEPINEKTEIISDFIFSSGSWGAIENQVLALAVRGREYRTGKRYNEKIGYVLQRLFPTLDELKGIYPVLRKAPALLPCVWVVRIFDKIFLDRDAVSRQRKMINAYNPKNQESFHLALKYVGLDYHFDDNI